MGVLVVGVGVYELRDFVGSQGMGQEERYKGTIQEGTREPYRRGILGGQGF
jgi:hypothetical protein